MFEWLLESLLEYSATAGLVVAAAYVVRWRFQTDISNLITVGVLGTAVPLGIFLTLSWGGADSWIGADLSDKLCDKLRDSSGVAAVLGFAYIVHVCKELVNKFKKEG